MRLMLLRLSVSVIFTSKVAFSSAGQSLLRKVWYSLYTTFLLQELKISAPSRIANEVLVLSIFIVLIIILTFGRVVVTFVLITVPVGSSTFVPAAFLRALVRLPGFVVLRWPSLLPFLLTVRLVRTFTLLDLVVSGRFWTGVWTGRIQGLIPVLTSSWLSFSTFSVEPCETVLPHKIIKGWLHVKYFFHFCHRRDQRFRNFSLAVCLEH